MLPYRDEANELTLLRLRQFPLYSKTEPPAALKDHFKEEVFKKSQTYGKDKAKFSLISGLFKQVVDSILMQFGLVAWSWKAGGWIVGKLGYGPEFEVRVLVVDFLRRVMEGGEHTPRSGYVRGV